MSSRAPTACRGVSFVACVAAMLLPVELRAQDPAPRVAVQIEVGAVWQGSNDVEIPNVRRPAARHLRAAEHRNRGQPPNRVCSWQRAMVRAEALASLVSTARFCLIRCS